MPVNEGIAMGSPSKLVRLLLATWGSIPKFSHTFPQDLANSYRMTHPWGLYNYLHEWLIMVNVGKYTIHGCIMGLLKMAQFRVFMIF